MDLTFLGAASTVTGSRFLLTTARAKVLVDCGMFQGSPNETIRNFVPLGMDPSTLDAILVTHAHLDHCGLLPVVVRDGFKGPIYLTSASAELVEIVLLDSGRLQEEFAKRHDRFERRHPDEAVKEDAADAAKYEAAVAEAKRAEEEGQAPTPIEPAGRADPDELPTLNPETTLRAQPPSVDAILDGPLYTEDDAKLVMPMFKPVRYGEVVQVAAGVTATFRDAGHILGSAIIHLEVQEADGGPTTTIVFSGDLGRPDTPILRDPTPMSGAD
jgi:metallo-beta-lactamase family protein